MRRSRGARRSAAHRRRTIAATAGPDLIVGSNLDDPNWKEAFLRPSGAHGTLVQIAQSSHPDDVVKHHLRPSNLDELLGS